MVKYQHPEELKPSKCSLEEIFAHLGSDADDTIDSLCEQIEKIPRSRVIRNQAFHQATITKLKRLLRILEESQVRMEEATPHRIISILGDLRQKTCVCKDGLTMKVMTLFASEIDGKDTIVSEDLQRLGNQLYAIAKEYKHHKSEDCKIKAGEVLARECKAFKDLARRDDQDDDKSLGHEIVRRFVALLNDTVENNNMKWLEYSGPFRFLSEDYKDLLPWTSIGFVLQLMLDQDSLRLEDIWFHTRTVKRIRKIAVKRIPRFTEKLSEIIATLEQQSGDIDHLRNKLLAGFAGIVAAAAPAMARMALSLVTAHSPIHDFKSANHSFLEILQ